MKKNTLLALAAIGILGYWYFRMRKKPAMTTDDLKAKPKDSTASTASTSAPQPIDKTRKQVQLEDIPYKMPQFVKPEKRVFVRPLKPVVKEDIYVSPKNVMPNLYDNNIGVDVYPDKNNYANFSGACSENIQTACRCSKAKNEKYKLNIPQLP